MTFPKCDRVIYDKNPLVEVVCQLRFPRILAINTSLPSEFQDRIRKEYPIYNEQIEYQQGISINQVGGELPVPRIMQGESIKNYRFSSADAQWHINLTSTFISLSTTGYTRWEDFKDKFSKPLEALNQIYEPAFFERVGLRYIDIFNRARLGAETMPWSRLLQPYVLGVLSSDDVSGNIIGHNINTEIRLENDEGIARLMAGLGNVPDVQEQCFIIDSDIYSLGRESCDVLPKLERLHDESSRLLRWAITEELHKLMGPRELE